MTDEESERRNAESKEFWAKNGRDILGEDNVHDDGIPKGAGSPGPPQPCIRCKALTESGVECAYAQKDVLEAAGVLCVDCHRLSFTNFREFCDGFGK